MAANHQHNDEKIEDLSSGVLSHDGGEDAPDQRKLIVDSQIKADIQSMSMALAEAVEAGEAGEVPVGAVLIMGGEVISRGRNSPIAMSDPTAHAEIIALRRAAETVGNYRLTGATLYVTLEPCLMCAGAILQARVSRLVFGAFDPKAGAVGSLYDVAADPRLNHCFKVTAGVMEEECAMLLKKFFRRRRINSNQGTV